MLLVVLINYLYFYPSFEVFSNNSVSELKCTVKTNADGSDLILDCFPYGHFPVPKHTLPPTTLPPSQPTLPPTTLPPSQPTLPPTTLPPGPAPPPPSSTAYCMCGRADYHCDQQVPPVCTSSWDETKCKANSWCHWKEPLAPVPAPSGPPYKGLFISGWDCGKPLNLVGDTDISVYNTVAYMGYGANPAAFTSGSYDSNFNDDWIIDNILKKINRPDIQNRLFVIGGSASIDGGWTAKSVQNMKTVIPKIASAGYNGICIDLEVTGTDFNGDVINGIVKEIKDKSNWGNTNFTPLCFLTTSGWGPFYTGGSLLSWDTIDTSQVDMFIPMMYTLGQDSFSPCTPAKPSMQDVLTVWSNGGKGDPAAGSGASFPKIPKDKIGIGVANNDCLSKITDLTSQYGKGSFFVWCMQMK